LIEPFDAIKKKTKKRKKSGVEVSDDEESNDHWLETPKNWTPEELHIAIQEAKTRRKNPNEVAVTIAKELTKISKSGVLRI